MKIFITTGIYPPKIGGPAQYAKNLKIEFEKKGYRISVKTYGLEDHLPTGIRHLIFFFRILPKIWSTEVVFSLDTFSVALPSIIAAKIFRKKIIIRIGGDFLWENYVERTHKPILLRNFYKSERNNFSLKEKMVFWITKWILRNATHLIFSTKWQRDIFLNPYKIDAGKTSIVENYYGPKESDLEPKDKILIASARNIFLKNQQVLEGFEVFKNVVPFNDLMEKIKSSYAVIVVSLSEISPNIILDAIRYNKPFICTKEVGIYERIKDAGIFVDPLDKKEIEKAVVSLLTEERYKEAKEKVRNFNFVHTWEQIADEFLTVYKNLNK